MNTELMFKAALCCNGVIPKGVLFILNTDKEFVYKVCSTGHVPRNGSFICNSTNLIAYVKDLFDKLPDDVYYIQYSNVSTYPYIGYNKDLSLRYVNGGWEKMIHPTRSYVSGLIRRSLTDPRGTSKFSTGSWCVSKDTNELHYILGYSMDGSLIVGSGPDSDRFIKVSKSEYEPIDGETAELIHAMIEAEPKDTNSVMRMRCLMEVVLKYKGL